MKKLNSAIRAALALGMLLSGSAAFAQSAQFNVSSLPGLPSTTVIDAAASNGVLLGHYTTQLTSQILNFGGGVFDTVTTGTDTYFLTGANGASPVTISVATYQNQSNGDGFGDPQFELTGGSTPAGAIGIGSTNSIGMAPNTFSVNSSGQILATGVDEFNATYLTKASGASPLNVGSPNGPSSLQLATTWTPPSVLSDSGATAGISLTNVINPITGASTQTSGVVALMAPGALTSPLITTSSSGPFTFSTLPSTTIAGLNSSSTVAAISNTRNRVAGTENVGGKEVGYVTGNNGVGVTLVGNTSGFFSTRITSVNDAGQVGGEVVTEVGGVITGETAFITSTAGAIVGIGAGNPGDFTDTKFLNDAGQAIVFDNRNEQYYLYNGGTIYSVDTLFGLDPSLDWTVVGLTSAGGVVLQDPGIYTITDFPTLGGTDNSSTEGFHLVSASEPSSGGSSVPAPGVLGLMGLGLAGLFARKRRNVIAAA